MDVHLLFNSKHLSGSPTPACTSPQVGLQKLGHQACGEPNAFLTVISCLCVGTLCLSFFAKRLCCNGRTACLQASVSHMPQNKTQHPDHGASWRDAGTFCHTQMLHERHPGPTERHTSAATAPVLLGPQNHLQMPDSALLMRTAAKCACWHVDITRGPTACPARQCLMTEGWTDALATASHHPC